MQNDYEITSKSQFWIRSVRRWTNSRNLDMSGPAKASPGGQVVVSEADFSSPEISPFQSLLASFSSFYKKKTHICKTENVNSEKNKCPADNNLSSQTGLGRSGHVQIPTVHKISHVSDLEITFCHNFHMILHPLGSRNPKRPQNL